MPPLAKLLPVHQVTSHFHPTNEVWVVPANLKLVVVVLTLSRHRCTHCSSSVCAFHTLSPNGSWAPHKPGLAMFVVEADNGHSSGKAYHENGVGIHSPHTSLGASGGSSPVSSASLQSPSVATGEARGTMLQPNSLGKTTDCSPFQLSMKSGSQTQPWKSIKSVSEFKNSVVLFGEVSASKWDQVV